MRDGAEIETSFLVGGAKETPSRWNLSTRKTKNVNPQQQKLSVYGYWKCITGWGTT